jgi:hypothetical protein
MMDPKWLAELLNAHAETLRLFEQIRSATGLEYKRLRELRIDTAARCPTWCDGTIVISPTHEARSISHELGHGMHEKIRETGKADKYGEDFAETIRWFVEKRMGPGPWCARLSKLPDQSAVVRACDGDLNTFLEYLRTGELFRRLDW